MVSNKQKIKILTTYDLATNLGQIIIMQSSNTEMKKLARKLLGIGTTAIDRFKIKYNNKIVNSVRSNIEKLYADKTEFDLLEGLHILFVGLSELCVKSGTKLYSNQLRDITLSIIQIIDPELKEEDISNLAYDKYQEWLT